MAVGGLFHLLALESAVLLPTPHFAINYINKTLTKSQLIKVYFVENSTFFEYYFGYCFLFQG